MVQILITCEHAVNFIPAKYRQVLSIPENILESHRGFDSGAFGLGKSLSGFLDCPFIAGECSRLLVDLNRSVSNKNLFSEYSRNLTSDQKNNVLEDFYFPYRQKIEKFVSEKINKKNIVIHFSVHSFTPVLKGKTRNAEIGLLYDPARSQEVNVAGEIGNLLKKLSKYLIIRKNYPYRGISDGVVTYLRKKFNHKMYIGLELEFNQKIFSDNATYNLIKNHLPDIICKVTSHYTGKIPGN